LYNRRDLAGITRVAIGVLWVYMVFNMLGGLSAFYADVVAPQPVGDGVANVVGIVAAVYVLALIASFILVGRWIYLASANAHAFSSEMTITPGWAVGWYFIPVANLFKPLQAMKEIWFASHPYGPGEREGTPPLLAWW
jgi:hypothetical protein